MKGVGKDYIELQELGSSTGSNESDTGSDWESDSGDRAWFNEVITSINEWLNERNSKHQRIVEWSYVVLSVCIMRLVFASLVFPNQEIQLIGCGDTDVIWKGRMDECGVLGEKCIDKFASHEKIKVRCPAFCRNGGKAWDVIRYANKTIQYEPFLIHGTSYQNEDIVYRADSFPCMAGIELGYVSELWGGSIELNLNDSWNKSEEFDADFPASFLIKPLKGGHDLFIAGIFTGIILSLGAAFLVFNEVLFYFTIFGIVYTTVVLCGDSPVEVSDLDSSLDLISIWIQRLVPLTSLVWLVRGKYKTLASRITWIIGLWITSLDNLTFEQLPIDRLVWNDIKNEKGGVVAVLGVFVLVLTCAVYQAWILYLEGKLMRYVINYSIGLIVFIIIGNLHSSGLTLRIHHWVIGLVLVWGCRETPPSSTLLHGLCLGLIINGIGRWGFASLLEPTVQVSRDHQDITVPKPNIDIDIISGNYTLNGFESCQIYVNDILFSRNCVGDGIDINDRYVRAWACIQGDHCRWSDTVVLTNLPRAEHDEMR
ncbi:hypothetical protein CANINC_003442 [Pichia inconspicua]|uniref:LCCL domain-containing protein n=1 Tax=Pichia inconspicua TaxID=52247 RepID=A0A4T0WYK6_9ASCO|nr:hypothetical protein CANINC_003442 [[Candida] inconspicua]